MSQLLEAARGGDERAFRQIVESHRSELHAHCYRMLGSVQDAEDAVQDSLLRAWRGLPRFDGRSELRTWLYAVATNVCRDAIARRTKRTLPIEHGAAAAPGANAGLAVVGARSRSSRFDHKSSGWAVRRFPNPAWRG